MRAELFVKKGTKATADFFSPRNCKKSSVTPLFFPGVDSYHSFCCCAEMTGQSAREEEKFLNAKHSNLWNFSR